MLCHRRSPSLARRAIRHRSPRRTRPSWVVPRRGSPPVLRSIRSPFSCVRSVAPSIVDCLGLLTRRHWQRDRAPWPRRHRLPPLSSRRAGAEPEATPTPRGPSPQRRAAPGEGVAALGVWTCTGLLRESHRCPGSRARSVEIDAARELSLTPKLDPTTKTDPRPAAGIGSKTARYPPQVRPPSTRIGCKATQVASKSAPNRGWIDARTSANRPRIDAGSTPKPPWLCPASTPGRTEIDLGSGPGRSCRDTRPPTNRPEIAVRSIARVPPTHRSRGHMMIMCCGVHLPARAMGPTAASRWMLDETLE